MATYTPNYGLHQWVPEDNFLRTDFNEDFRKIDTAMGRGTQTELAMGYNMYRMLLQNEWDGKETSWVKGFVFDSFTSNKKIQNKTQGMMLDTDTHHLWLTALPEENFSQGVPGKLTDTVSYTWIDLPWHPEGSGHLTGLTLYFVGPLTVRLLLGDDHGQVLAEANLMGENPDGAFYPLEADIWAGERYTLLFAKNDGIQTTFYYGQETGIVTNKLVYTRHITPNPVFHGVLISQPTQLYHDFHTEAAAWLRYSGGTVKLELNDGTGWQEMIPSGERILETKTGILSREQSLMLPHVTGQSLQARMTLDASPGLGCKVYDYGILVY